MEDLFKSILKFLVAVLLIAIFSAIVAALASCTPDTHQNGDSHNQSPVMTPSYNRSEDVRPTWDSWAKQQRFCWCIREGNTFVLTGACQNEPVPSELMHLCSYLTPGFSPNGE